jgi:hypothetical protein
MRESGPLDEKTAARYISELALALARRLAKARASSEMYRAADIASPLAPRRDLWSPNAAHQSHRNPKVRVLHQKFFAENVLHAQAHWH